MPTFANRLLLISFFQYRCDFRIAINRFEETIDVDRAKPPRKCQMFIGTYVLVSDDDNRIFRKRRLNRLKVFVTPHISAENFSTQCTS